MDTSVFEFSDFGDDEFYWENDQMDVYAVFRPGTDTPFPPTAFDDSEMGSSADNPILLDEDEDKKNTRPTTKICERPTQPSALLRSCPFGTTIENVLQYV